MKKYHKQIFVGMLLGLTVLIPRAFTQLLPTEMPAEQIADITTESHTSIVGEFEE